MILVPVLGAAAGYFYSSNQEEVYEASATLLVEQRSPSFVPGLSDFRLSTQLATTYARKLKAQPFLSSVRETSDLPRLGSIKTTVKSDPPALEISVQDRDPALAAESANTLAQQFLTFILEQRLADIASLQAAAVAYGISNADDVAAAQLAAVDSLSLLEPVIVPVSPILPRTNRNIVLGTIMGLMLATGVSLMMSMFRDTVRDPDELSRRFNVTSLGMVFKWSPSDVQEQDLVAWTAPSSGYSESFRQIRANIQFATVDQDSRVFLVTSPGPGEGKSTIICNLAISMAQTGKRVIVLDGDLRRPTVHRKFPGASREPGLSTLLSDPSVTLDSVLWPTEIEGVSIIPGGPIPPNPSELLGSSRMAGVLEQVKDMADIVLVDSPPILMVADAPMLAVQVDGAIVVVDGFGTKSSALRAAIDALKTTQVRVVGVIINKLKRVRFGYAYGYPYYYDYYYYRYYASDVDGALANGRGAIYKRPVNWARSALSKLRRP